MIGAGADIKCGAKGGDGLTQQSGAFCALGTAALDLQGSGEVVLRHGPVQRMIGAGADLKCGAVGGDGLGQQCGAFCAIGADALV